MRKQLISEERLLNTPVSGRTETTGSTALARWCRNLFFRRIGRIEKGCILLRERGSAQLLGDPAALMWVVVEVFDPRFYVRLLFGGSVGSGDAYMEGLLR